MLLLLCLLARASEVPTAPTLPVVRVDVEGTRRVEPTVVLAAVHARAGQPLTEASARADLEALYATGLFDDARLVTTPEGDGVVVRIVVAERPAVREVVLSGVKDSDEDDVKELIDVRPFTVPSDRAIDDAISRIRDHYVDDGYFLAEVTPVRIPVDDGLVDLRVEVEQGRKVVVRKVDVIGNENLSDRRIRRYLGTKEGGFAPWLTQRGAFSTDTLRGDAETLHALYWEEGYLDVDVDPPRAYLTPDRRFVEVSFQVHEGTRYDVGAVDVTGEFRPDLGLTREAAMRVVDGWSPEQVQEDQWRLANGLRSIHRPRGSDGPALRTGEPFRYSTYGTVSANLGTLYEDRGFAEPSVLPRFDTDPERSVVDLSFTVVPGDRVRIGRIDIGGNDPTLDRVIRRELLLDEGDWYAGSLARASRMRLMRLGWFDTVDVATRPGDEDGEVALAVDVVEKPTGSFNAGAGYGGTRGGLSLMASGAKDDFLGLGLGFAASINWSGVARDGSFSLSDPRFMDSRWSLDGAVYHRTVAVGADRLGTALDLSSSGRREAVWGTTLGVGRAFGRRGDLHVDAHWSFEDRELKSITETERRLLGGDLFRDGVTSRLGVTFAADERDSRVSPRKGWYLGATASVAGGGRIDDKHVVSLLGGEFFYAETELTFRGYHPLLPDEPRSPVLRFNAQLGKVWSLDGRAVPFVARYRAGGILSVRGYQDLSLGPTLRILGDDDPVRADDLLVIGGTESFVTNTEVEFPIVPGTLTGVVFFDAGNTFGDAFGRGHVSPFDLRTSIGLGARMSTPMGLLRLEVGLPLSRDPAIRKQLVGFTIGGTF